MLSNGSSLPPRLPALSHILKVLSNQTNKGKNDAGTHYVCAALSYRGYWKSHGRASQRGIEIDACAFLDWAQERYNHHQNTQFVLWGQSLGSNVALTALSQYLRKPRFKEENPFVVAGIILETPFVSVRRMLTALYPQKWLPYRYLWPFLLSTWDNDVALHHLSDHKSMSTVPFLILKANKDEVVPAEQTNDLLAIGTSKNLNFVLKGVSNALHNEASIKTDGKKAIINFISMAIAR